MQQIATSYTSETPNWLSNSQSRMASFLCGRLHGINPDVLRVLKKELRGFNAQTGEWNEK